jgi:polyisoprenyl-phosphate glycosyltransferase
VGKVSIVIPIHNDLPSLTALLAQLAHNFALAQESIRIVVVDDGSSPPIVATGLTPPDRMSVELLTLKRNVGHQRAIAVGLAYEAAQDRCDIIAVMDGDGEDRPEDLSRLIAQVRSTSGASIVVAERTRRSEGLRFAVSYHAYRLLFLLLVGERIRFGSFVP